MTSDYEVVRDALDETLADERHHGWGLATAEDLGPRARDEALDAVAGRALEMGLSYEALFQFADCRWARHMIDEVHGSRSPRETREIIDRWMGEGLFGDLSAELGEDLLAQESIVAVRSRA
jgi:hypothetical protein